MRKKEKRFLQMMCMALAFTLTLHLAACGSNKGGAADSDVLSSEQSDASGGSLGGNKTEEPDVSEEPQFELDEEMKADRELKAAYDMGLLTKELAEGMERTITYGECAELLYRMLSLLDQAAADDWKAQDALCFGSERPMKMDDAVLLYYFAAHDALGYPCVATAEDYHMIPKDWEALKFTLTWSEVQPVREISNGSFGCVLDSFNYYFDRELDTSWDYPCFPGWEERGDAGWGTFVSAFAFTIGQRSYVSNTTMFDFVWEGDVLFAKNLTVQNAVRAAVRLYESSAVQADESQIREIYGEADIRREAILNSPTTIEKASEYVPGKTYSGTAYYVSNDGSDENDGLTPETPLQTLDRVNVLDLKKGDAVFFCRGDIWRGGLAFRDGVTYSAYGEGRKPRFYGSGESGVGEEKWELYYTGSGGEKIWKYYRELPDTGGIVFDDGESYALRAYSWWSAEKKAHVCIYDTDKLFVPEKELEEDGDLTFCVLVDYGDKQYPIICYEYDDTDRGGLYLRCDKGNPGALYREIEFENNEANPGFGGPVASEYRAGEAVLDNLSVRYWGANGIMPWATDMIYIQNCEVAWGGNRVHTIIQAEPTTECWLSGDGIYAGGTGGIMTNNYVHDLDGAGITLESSVHVNHEYQIIGNLVERCGQGIYLHGGEGLDLNVPILIDDNIVLDTGEGNVHGCFNSYNGIWVDDFNEYNAPIRISNNLVYHAHHNLIAGLSGVEELENNWLYR